MDPADARDKLSELRLIDLRTREEHEAVKIGGSEFFTQELQQQLFGGDPEASILLYDHSGQNVLDQVAWFRGHGLKQTFGLRGGIDAWSREVDSSIPRYRLEMDAWAASRPHGGQWTAAGFRERFAGWKPRK